MSQVTKNETYTARIIDNNKSYKIHINCILKRIEKNFSISFSFHQSRITLSFVKLQVENFRHNFHYNKPPIFLGRESRSTITSPSPSAYKRCFPSSFNDSHRSLVDVTQPFVSWARCSLLGVLEIKLDPRNVHHTFTLLACLVRTTNIDVSLLFNYISDIT